MRGYGSDRINSCVSSPIPGRYPKQMMNGKPDTAIRYALPEEERARHDSFLRAYREIRRDEGRGSDDPEFYLRLPEGDFTGQRAKEWRMRAESLAWLLGYLDDSHRGRLLTILDAGAGNCWMTRRLAERGHRVTALDLNDDDYDGLGAGGHYLERLPVSFKRVAADFSRLPFADAAFDLVVYNGALHYAGNIEAVIAEGKRTLKEGGEIVLIDTPFYRNAESGEKMLAGRGAQGGGGYVTFDLLETVARRLDLELRFHPRPLSLLRRLKRRLLELRLGRETARMPWVVLRKTGP